MVDVIVVAVLFAVIFVISQPLRRATALRSEDDDGSPDPTLAPEVLDLQAQRDAKYREIRDAELDRQTGKLSDADHAAIDSTLRAEAIEILRRLDDTIGSD